MLIYSRCFCRPCGDQLLRASDSNTPVSTASVKWVSVGVVVDRRKSVVPLMGLMNQKYQVRRRRAPHPLIVLDMLILMLMLTVEVCEAGSTPWIDWIVSPCSSLGKDTCSKDQQNEGVRWRGRRKDSEARVIILGVACNNSH